jgi:hypothetical protein
MTMLVGFISAHISHFPIRISGEQSVFPDCPLVCFGNSDSRCQGFDLTVARISSSILVRVSNTSLFSPCPITHIKLCKFLNSCQDCHSAAAHIAPKNVRLRYKPPAMAADSAGGSVAPVDPVEVPVVGVSIPVVETAPSPIVAAGPVPGVAIARLQ